MKHSLFALFFVLMFYSFTLANSTPPDIQEQYGKLPLSFESNQGQTDPKVKFFSKGNGYSLFLTANEAVLTLKPKPQNSKERLSEAAALQGDGIGALQTTLRMRLAGPNRNPKVSGEEILARKSHYLIGNDPKKWRTDVPNYKKVQYHDIYPGVDLVYYGNQSQLEYDFVVRP